MPCRTQGVSETLAKASQAAKDATGQLKERTSKVSSVKCSYVWLAINLWPGHAREMTYIGVNLQTASSMQDQVRSAAEAYTKPAEQSTPQSTTEQAQSPASDSTSGPNSTAATSSPQQQQQQQQQQTSQTTSASSSKEGPEMHSQAESTARHGHTSTSGNSNQQSGSNQKATDAKSEGKPEGLMYRLRSIREAVKKEVCATTDSLSCMLLPTPFTLFTCMQL